jgi:hypothetical protein
LNPGRRGGKPATTREFRGGYVRLVGQQRSMELARR